MNDTDTPRTALGSGRDWTALPDQDKLLEWSLDSDGDFLQGPLDLICMRGRKAFLNLADEQLALLAVEDQLQAIYLDGGHVLDIGLRPGQINPQGRLYFLDASRFVDLRWTHGSPIALPVSPSRHIIGTCQLVVTGPSRFFEQFIQNAPVPDLMDIQDQIEAVTRTTLIDFLSSGQADDQASLQSTLMNLSPDSLTEELQGVGLACRQLALYTAQPPVEDCLTPVPGEEFTGQNPQFAHN
jgi:hypothetical protein